jgi:hypothetical protein
MVNYTMGGKATLGSDYTLSGPADRVVIPAGQTSATVVLSSIADHLKEKKESAKIILAPGSGYTLNKNHKSAIVQLMAGP